MLIDRAGIERLVPHSGSMCLLDAVLNWDSESIVCSTASHRRDSNPFRESGELQSVILVEYGAQAAAVHAGLVQQGLGRGAGHRGTAYIGAVKDLLIRQATVDPAIETLQIQAQCLLNSNDGAIYRIQCKADEQLLLAARVVLVLPG